MNFDQNLQDFRKQIEEALKVRVPYNDGIPDRLVAAMQHSLFAGGKRIRPLLLLGTYHGKPSNSDPLPAAAALECLHTYSLIHDDLPGMDDSDLRRGRPTCHKAFDEATAILAGDALLNLAFECISSEYSKYPELANSLIRELSTASGAGHLIGGQMDDILMESSGDSDPASHDINFIEDRKTGALFMASLRMGCLLGDYPDEALRVASRMGLSIGRAFQVMDDVLDEIGDEKTVGKSLRQDTKNKKITAITVFGLEGAKQKVFEHMDDAQKSLMELCPRNEFMTGLLKTLRSRVK